MPLTQLALVDSAQLESDLSDVADAIRAKSGGSGTLAFPAGFISEIGNIQTGITPTGTKQISITENGTTTEDVTNYASAEITVNVQSGGSGTSIITETVDVTVDNARQTEITIPVASTDYDNIVATFSVTDTWHYDNGVAVKDDVPTFPSNNDGFDFCGAFVKMAAMQRFTGYTYTALQTDYPPVYRMNVASRNTATPQAYGSTSGITINAASIVWNPGRAFCQAGYKMTFRFKILFWDD